MPRTDLKPEPGANPPPSSSSDSSRPAASSSALLDLISGHLTPTMSSSGKDPITCHVLDTTAGRPAKGIRVRLEGPSFASPATNNHTSSSAIGAPADGGNNAAGGLKSFEAFTDDDGRVKVWLPYSSETSAGEVPVHTLVDVLANVRGPSRWTLRFDTEGYFGEAATFFPEATVVFRVDEGQHYHVPLLLSPYSYTTYRGS